MREDLANHGGLLDGDDDLQSASTVRAMLDVEDAL
jgi:hypothetical protein